MMKVKELIEEVKKQDPEATVSSTDQNCCACSHEEVDYVEVIAWGLKEGKTTVYIGNY